MATRSLERKRSESLPEPGRKILIAIDFGTTYSGCAWVHTSKPDAQNLVIQWTNASSDGLEGVTSDKVPTEILYDDNGMMKWGFQIPLLSERYRYFKLQLDPSQPGHSFGMKKSLPNRRAMALSGQDSLIEKLITDFLSALRKQVEQVLCHKIPQSALKSTPISYCMTVPALWSDSSQARTRKCAEMAGLNKNGDLQMISEPEAAAIYTLDAMDPHDLEIGDTFVLCDAGGGTVDLISYNILALGPRLELKEVVPGSGGLCGSTFLNERFAEFLINRFGKETGWDDQTLEGAIDFFNVTIKRSYHGGPDEKYLVHVSGLADNPSMGVRRGKFTLTGQDLHTLFQPVLKDIITLVKDQIRSMRPNIPKAVLLVGGFGQSSYLRVSIKNTLAGSDTGVMQPPNGWSAVVRGALMKGLMGFSPSSDGPKVSGRVARRFYGLEVEVPFQEDIHDDSRRYWDSCDGIHRVSIIKWCIKRGDTIKEREPIKLPYYRDELVSKGHPSQLHSQLFVYDGIADAGAPLYQSREVTKLVVLTADMSKIPKSKSPLITGGDGCQYYRIKYHIHVTVLSGSIKYDLVYKSENYGTVKADYQ